MPNGNNIPAKCMIVDDEPMARDVIREYIEHIPYLSVVGEFGNAIDAMTFLKDNPVYLIFLDIRMPQLNGTDFIRSLPKVPKVIFTTAHKEYAHEGFDLDVVDYLLKPIRFDRFLRAVNKAFQQRPQESDIGMGNGNDENKFALPFMYVRVERKMVKVFMDDILYIESDKDHVKIFTAGENIITRQTLNSVEAMLGKSQFFRIHRSYIVALDKIKSFSHDIVTIDNKELPIGKMYRHSFLELQGS